MRNKSDNTFLCFFKSLLFNLYDFNSKRKFWTWANLDMRRAPENLRDVMIWSAGGVAGRQPAGNLACVAGEGEGVAFWML